MREMILQERLGAAGSSSSQPKANAGTLKIDFDDILTVAAQRFADVDGADVYNAKAELLANDHDGPLKENARVGEATHR